MNNSTFQFVSKLPCENLIEQTPPAVTKIAIKTLNYILKFGRPGLT